MSLWGSSFRHGRTYYYGWATVFFVLLFLACFGLYWATQQVDYVWRWHRVPQYFYYEDNVEIKAEIAGEIQSITEQGENEVVVIKGDDGETESYSVPKGGLAMSQGDFAYPGDVIGGYKQWKVGILIQGLWVTLKVSIIAIIVGIFLGLLTGLARLSENPVLKWSAITYIELIRGSPLLVQIFIWYFIFGTLVNSLLKHYGLHQEIPHIWFGVASLACFAGAYVAEIVRAGIQSIHRGQREAARSLGMNTFQSMRHVILPQAFRRILPPLAGQFISLIKDSSLLGIIAVRELTKATREVVSSSLMTFELWFMCAVLYLVLTFTLSMLLQYMEKRMVNA